MKERISMHSHRPSATSQPSLFSHTHNLMAGGCCDGGVCYTEKATAVMEACMAAVPVGAMRLLGCPVTTLGLPFRTCLVLGR